LELEGDRSPSPFYLGHFSSSNFFDHITKDVSVFHLELGDSYRLNYLSTSPPQDTPAITTVDLLQAIDF
jgi:hypothetical protein